MERLDPRTFKIPVLLGKDIIKTMQLLPGVKARERKFRFYVRGGNC